MKVADLNVITCTSFTLACRTWNSSTTPQSNAIGCDHCQQPWMAGSQRGSIASQHLELRPGSWYDNELCRLLFMHHVTCKTPSLPKPNPRRRRPRWLIMTGDGGLCASRQKPGTTAEAHVVPPEKQRAASATGHPKGRKHCHNDAAGANEKWNLSSLSPRPTSHTWLTPGRKRFAAQTSSSDAETPWLSHLYYTATLMLERCTFFFLK